MSDNEGTKAKSGWTDKERLTYLFALIENSNVKFEYNSTPRPTGRSVIACQRMIERLKGTLKNELEALKAGHPIEDSTPKKPTSAPRKRKGKEADANGDEGASPSKKGRKKKGAAMEAEAEKTSEQDGDEEMKVKTEVQEE
ncbi:hypothetical protein BKA63DRAFT_550206 [Paraphoma chrysanthemicola]|nr:hypothetical protein BKA63DRAFT_550206 [Paraphoma chrysanthemicola]